MRTRVVQATRQLTSHATHASSGKAKVEVRPGKRATKTNAKPSSLQDMLPSGADNSKICCQAYLLDFKDCKGKGKGPAQELDRPQALHGAHPASSLVPANIFQPSNFLGAVLVDPTECRAVSSARASNVKCAESIKPGRGHSWEQGNGGMGACCSCCGLCTSAAGKITQRSARIAYCGLFALSLIIAWILRECSAPLMRKISWINTSSSTVRSNEWLEMQAVLRVSLGSFLFFALLSLLMIGVKDQKDWRDSVHHGGWTAKLIGWFILTVLMFFLPNGVITAYGILSIFGSGFFLLIQVIILLDFTHNWNAAWVAKDEQFWYVALLVASVISYLGTFTLSGFLYYWFNPSGESCSLNVFFITMTLILAAGFCIASLHPKVNGSLLPAAVISLYCAYVCYTGLSSEPRLGLQQPSFLLHLLLVEQASPYWNLVSKRKTTRRPSPAGQDSEELVDVGWPSVWVRISTEWLTAGLFMWSLVAPLIFPDREF
ncbi:hypothetical protein GOP47_0016202 [Adiantum capillus-veneris]|uniref:Serine incorporator n=1 Tax=Adiantum capillus-veneris TaxID=13818 RepID=A0A9D4UHN3_ADICA|nr:hypothetical protein GOP47_0016202 [Adiantum capillus-veneris]